MLAFYTKVLFKLVVIIMPVLGLAWIAYRLIVNGEFRTNFLNFDGLPLVGFLLTLAFLGYYTFWLTFFSDTAKSESKKASDEDIEEAGGEIGDELKQVKVGPKLNWD